MTNIIRSSSISRGRSIFLLVLGWVLMHDSDDKNKKQRSRRRRGALVLGTLVVAGLVARRHNRTSVTPTVTHDSSDDEE